MIIGLVWAVVYYLTTDYPIPHIALGTWPSRSQSSWSVSL